MIFPRAFEYGNTKGAFCKYLKNSVSNQYA
jgi:hypothetical protein